MDKTIFNLKGTLVLDNKPCELSDALYLLVEEGLCTAMDVPKFEHGQKLVDCEGDACSFIGPSGDGMQAVVEYEDSNRTITRCHWGDLSVVHAEVGS